MEVNFCSSLHKNIHFSGYKNSKYSNEYTSSSLLDKSAATESAPKCIDLDDDASIYKYSRQQIRDLYRFFGLNEINNKQVKKRFKKRIDSVRSKVSDCSVNSSNMEMILDLVKYKKLTPEILCNVYEGGQISKRVNDDLDKLYSAYAENKNIKEVFVPKFGSLNEALDNIEIGDVCQIEGQNNIAAKLPDGSIKEMFITPETYLELFPPVERFIVNQSHSMGDCYLLAAVDSINQNPYLRHKILEMFRENTDGAVDAAFSGFCIKDDKVVQKNPENVLLKDISAQIHRNLKADVMSYTSEGFRAIELLHEKERSSLKKRSIEWHYKHFMGLKQYIKNNERILPLLNDCFFVFEHSEDEIREMQKKFEENNCILANDGRIYTEEEIDHFCSYIENGREDELFCKQLGDYHKNAEVTKDDILKKLTELEGKEDEVSRYERLVLERYLDYLERNNKYKTTAYNELLPKEIYADIFKVNEADMFYNHAGRSEEVFKMFDLDIVKNGDKDYHLLNSHQTKKMLFANDVDKFVFECSAGRKIPNNDFPIYTSHAYSLEPVDINGERKFIVRNPHNSMNETIYTYEELNRYFDTITVAKMDE